MTEKDEGSYTCQATNVLGEASTTGKLEIQRKTLLISLHLHNFFMLICYFTLPISV